MQEARSRRPPAEEPEKMLKCNGISRSIQTQSEIPKSQNAKEDRDSGSKDRQGGHEQDRNAKIAQATKSQLKEVYRISTQLQYCQKVVASASDDAPRRGRDMIASETAWE